MKNLLVALLVCFATSLSAQSDEFSTKSGKIKITPILHGSLIIEWKDEVIYVDPYGGAKAFENQKDPTIVLITDIHGDHLNTETLESINTASATFVVPQAVADQLDDQFKERIEIISNGESQKVNKIPITAIPMYNLPESPDSRHTKGRGNGYLLTLANKRIYISGDTEDIAEMRALKNIDVAFVCMNLPYTMSIDQAASAVLSFQPKVVYPYHYRGKGGLSDVEGFKRGVESKNPNIDVRLRDWYSE